MRAHDIIARSVRVPLDYPGSVWLPPTPAELASVLGIATNNVLYLARCREASGNLVDEVAARNLVTAGAPRYAVETPGLTVDGRVWHDKGIEITASADTFAHTTDPQIADLTASPFTVLWFGSVLAEQVNGITLFGREITGAFGWALKTTGPGLGGNAVFAVRNSVGTFFTSTTVGQLQDGGAHWGAGRWSGTQNTVGIDGIFDGTPQTPTGTITGANATLRLAGSLQAGASALATHFYLAIVSVALTDVQFAALVAASGGHGTLWSYPTGLVHTRAARLMTRVDDRVGSGWIGWGASPQVATMKSSNALGDTSPLRQAPAIFGARTNICQNHNALATAPWATLVGGTVSERAIVGPDGKKSGNLLTPTLATHGRTQSTATPVAANMIIAANCWRQSANGNSARLVLKGTTVAGPTTRDFACDTDPNKSYQLVAPLGTKTGNIAFDILPDVTAGTVALGVSNVRVFVATGPVAGALTGWALAHAIPTGAASQASANATLSLPVSHLPVAGRLRCRVTLPWSVADDTQVVCLFSLHDGTTNNELFARINVVANSLELRYVSAAVERGRVRQDALGWTAGSEHVVECWWNAGASFADGKAMALFLDGVKVTSYPVDPLAPFAAATVTTLHLGSDRGAASWLDGSVYDLTLEGFDSMVGFFRIGEVRRIF